MCIFACHKLHIKCSHPVIISLSFQPSQPGPSSCRPFTPLGLSGAAGGLPAPRGAGGALSVEAVAVLDKAVALLSHLDGLLVEAAREDQVIKEVIGS